MSRSLLASDYFINESYNGDTTSARYWEPHTSSVDFCESNYFFSDIIVEPHNVWSSLLGLSLFGVLGIYCGNPTREWRTFLIYFVLLVIGLGSAALHASLHWFFQSFDELPMIYLIICCAYGCLEVDSPRDQPRYPNLGAYLFLLSCINTAIYYTFQHLYVFFLATLSTMIALVVCLHMRIAWKLFSENRNQKKKENNNNNGIALRFYIWHYIAFLGVAVPIWFLDQFHCEYLLPIYNALPFPLKGMTLHVVWHICSGIGAHCFIQFLCACRASTLRLTCDTRYVLGVLPVVVVTPKATAVMKQA